MHVSDTQPTIAAHVVRSVVERLNDWHFDTAALLSEASLERAALNHWNGFVPLAAYVALLESAARRAGDPRLGLKLAAAIGPEALGPMGFAFLSAQSLQAALYALQRYIKTIQDSTRQQVIEREDHVQLTYKIEDDRIALRRQDAEFSIGLIHHIMKTYCGRKFRPFEVHFEHEPLGPLKAYDEYFGCPVYFGQDCNLIALRTDTLRVFSPTVNGALHRLLSDQLEQSLRTRADQETFAERVRALLTDEAVESMVRACDIAKMLGVSVSTMNRRLALEHLSFGELLARKRRQMAERLLACSDLPIAEIASRLGYGENATLSRSFQRWTGMSPRQFRRLRPILRAGAATPFMPGAHAAQRAASRESTAAPDSARRS